MDLNLKAEQLPMITPDHNNGIDNIIDPGFSPFPTRLFPQPIVNQPIARPNPGMMGGVGQYLQPMINQINQHYQQEQVQPFVQEVTSLANERFPDAFGGGLGGMRPIAFDVARPMPAGDIFSGISGSALSLLQAR